MFLLLFEPHLSILTIWRTSPPWKIGTERPYASTVATLYPAFPSTSTRLFLASNVHLLSAYVAIINAYCYFKLIKIVCYSFELISLSDTKKETKPYKGSVF